MEQTQTRTIWEIHEEPRKGAEETTALFAWSMNFDYPTPATVFLGLIGYGEEQYGAAMPIPQGAALGFLELDYIGDALKEYANNPRTVTEAIEELLAAEEQR